MSGAGRFSVAAPAKKHVDSGPQHAPQKKKPRRTKRTGKSKSQQSQKGKPAAGAALTDAGRKVLDGHDGFAAFVVGPAWKPNKPKAATGKKKKKGSGKKRSGHASAKGRSCPGTSHLRAGDMPMCVVVNTSDIRQKRRTSERPKSPKSKRSSGGAAFKKTERLAEYRLIQQALKRRNGPLAPKPKPKPKTTPNLTATPAPAPTTPAPVRQPAQAKEKAKEKVKTAAAPSASSIFGPIVPWPTLGKSRHSTNAGANAGSESATTTSAAADWSEPLPYLIDAYHKRRILSAVESALDSGKKLCIMINGPVASGKTFTMNLINRRFFHGLGITFEHVKRLHENKLAPPTSGCILLDDADGLPEPVFAWLKTYAMDTPAPKKKKAKAPYHGKGKTQAGPEPFCHVIVSCTDPYAIPFRSARFLRAFPKVFKLFKCSNGFELKTFVRREPGVDPETKQCALDIIKSGDFPHDPRHLLLMARLQKHGPSRSLEERRLLAPVAAREPIIFDETRDFVMHRGRFGKSKSGGGARPSSKCIEWAFNTNIFGNYTFPADRSDPDPKHAQHVADMQGLESLSELFDRRSLANIIDPMAAMASFAGAAHCVGEGTSNGSSARDLSMQILSFAAVPPANPGNVTVSFDRNSFSEAAAARKLSERRRAEEKLLLFLHYLGLQVAKPVADPDMLWQLHRPTGSASTFSVDDLSSAARLTLLRLGGEDLKGITDIVPKQLAVPQKGKRKPSSKAGAPSSSSSSSSGSLTAMESLLQLFDRHFGVAANNALKLAVQKTQPGLRRRRAWNRN